MGELNHLCAGDIEFQKQAGYANQEKQSSKQHPSVASAPTPVSRFLPCSCLDLFHDEQCCGNVSQINAFVMVFESQQEWPELGHQVFPSYADLRCKIPIWIANLRSPVIQGLGLTAVPWCIISFPKLPVTCNSAWHGSLFSVSTLFHSALTEVRTNLSSESWHHPPVVYHGAYEDGETSSSVVQSMGVTRVDVMITDFIKTQRRVVWKLPV